METTTVITDAIPRRDTRRSWRALRTVTVWVCSGVAAVFGFWESAVPNNRQTDISKFESSLTAYINAANAANYSELGLMNADGSGFDPFILAGSTPVADAKGHPATPDLIAAEKRLLAAYQNLTYENQSCARRVIKQAGAVYIQQRLPAGFSSVSPTDNSVVWENGSLAPWQDVSARETWLITSQVLLKSLGFGAASAVAAWIAAWLIVVAVAFVWWFFIDRLRDIATAVRGH